MSSVKGFKPLSLRTIADQDGLGQPGGDGLLYQALVKLNNQSAKPDEQVGEAEFKKLPADLQARYLQIANDDFRAGSDPLPKGSPRAGHSDAATRLENKIGFGLAKDFLNIKTVNALRSELKDLSWGDRADVLAWARTQSPRLTSVLEQSWFTRMLSNPVGEMQGARFEPGFQLSANDISPAAMAKYTSAGYVVPTRHDDGMPILADISLMSGKTF